MKQFGVWSAECGIKEIQNRGFFLAELAEYAEKTKRGLNVIS
jgi:hypothetical protein